MQRLSYTEKQLVSARKMIKAYHKVSECLRAIYSSNQLPGELQDEELLRIIKLNNVSEARLHVPFLFSSPLVVKYRTNEKQEGTKAMPPIDYKREYDDLLNSLGDCGTLVREKKIHATIDNLAQVLAERPVALHFSGHGIENNRDNFGQESVLYSDQGSYFLVLEDSCGGAELLSEKMLRDLIEANQL